MEQETIDLLLNFLLNDVVPPLLVILGGVALHFVRKYVNKAADKLGIEQTQVYIDTVSEIVTQGITYAEQLAKKKAKELEYVDGDGKLHLATKYIIDELRRRELPEMAADEVKDKIESYLGRVTFETASFQEGLGNDDGTNPPPIDEGDSLY